MDSTDEHLLRSGWERCGSERGGSCSSDADRRETIPAHDPTREGSVLSECVKSDSLPDYGKLNMWVFKSYQQPNPVMKPKFELGQVVVSTAVREALEAAGQTPEFFLQKHAAGDWGELCSSDKQLNNIALVQGGRVLSSYRTVLGVQIWVITDGERCSTCLCLPEEY